MRTRGRLCFIVAIALALAACRSQPHFTTDALPRHDGGLSLLLMPIDLELMEVAPGGLIEPKADWTQTAATNMTDVVRALVSERQGELVFYNPPADDPARAHLHDQLIKLHETVADSILAHQYEAHYKLPGKSDRLDWSLGPSVALLRHEFGADYALFIYFRDSYKSLGRTAAMMTVPISFLGVGLASGAQVGVASLVDLRNGDVVWFNRMVRTVGELRTPDGTRETMATLLESLPR
ncbi:MAG: hypothetical protein AB7K86_15335 [Rhodospirillales bacterium]